MSSFNLYMSQSEWDHFNQSMSELFDTQYIRTTYELPIIQELPFSDRGCFNRGIPKTEDHKANLALANIGKKATLETKEKLSHHSKKLWCDKDYRENISIKRKELWKNNYSRMKNAGKTQEWLITEPNGKEYKIKNLKDFCRENNLNSNTMYSVAKGKQKSYNGWCCRKATDS